jgi:hypothetical protein
MIFQVNFYKIGQKVQRSFGVFSIGTGRWSLYANKTTGVAEIQMDAEEAWLVPLIQDEDGRMVETWATECRNGLYYTTDKSVSKTPVAVEYGPQLVSGSAIFLAFKLGVTDIYSKALPTVALQKTSAQRATEEGASVALCVAPLGCPRDGPPRTCTDLCAVCRCDEGRVAAAAGLESSGGPRERPSGQPRGVDIGRQSPRRCQARLHLGLRRCFAASRCMLVVAAYCIVLYCKGDVQFWWACPTGRKRTDFGLAGPGVEAIGVQGHCGTVSGPGALGSG